MRKNFTQLIMGLALMVGFSSISLAQCDPPIPAPPGSIYNFQFDGGLEGWRTLDASGFEATNGWAWSETGDISMGAYGPDPGSVIGSESQCNGAMVMDSDFLDNNGTQGAFGTGACPSPCNSYLVSPVMDFSTSEAVDLTFFQSLRQFQSEYYIYVSVDGGASNRDTIELNDELPVNSAHIQEPVSLPFCYVQGEANVVVTFHYVGDYYYWALDDITFQDADPTVDMRVNSNFYTKVANYATPANMGTTVPILADIENVRAFESPESELIFRARNSFQQEIFSASRAYPVVPGCSTDENKVFADFYTMPDEEGFYSVEFEIVAEGDVNPDNNIITAPFKITEREFRKLPTEEEHGSPYLSGFRYGDGLISWGSYFQIPQNDGNQAIESITLGYTTSTQDSIPSPGIVNIGIYEWVDFEDIGTVNEGERRLLGEVDVLIQPFDASEKRITFTPFTETGDSIVPDPGTELLIVGHTNPFNEMTNYFFYAVDQTGFPEYSASANNLAHREAGLVGGYGSFAAANSASHDDRHDRELFNVDGGVVWDISMLLSEARIVGTEDINEDLSINIFPSPASEKVTVELNLDEVSDKVSIELTDMAGNRAGIYNFSNIKNDELSIDVSEYPGGMYLMNIRTEAGMISKKISVIH